MLQKFRNAGAAPKSTAAPVQAPARPTGPATVESLGQQLREVLPARRLQSVSLCDHEANVLWLSEGALGPDEHMLVTEALEVLAGDSSLPCHETAVEDGRLAVFLPVRAPTGALVGVAMILADSKSIGDNTIERLTATPVRTIMQRLAVLLKPSGMLAAAPPPAAEPAEAPVAPEAREPEPPPAVSEVEVAVVSEVEVEVEVTLAPVSTPEPESEVDDEDSETIISAAEIANILELELAPDELSGATTPGSAPAAAARAAAKPPAAPVPADDPIADSGMLKLEFLAEPPVVRPPPNPTVVAKKLQAASKAAEVAPTRAPRPLPATPAQAGSPSAPVAAAVPRAPAAPAPPAAGKTAAARTAAPTAPQRPFEPAATEARLSLHESDDVLVLFDSDPVSVPSRAGAPAQPTRITPAARIPPPVRPAPAARGAPPPTAAPAPVLAAAPAPPPAVVHAAAAAAGAVSPPIDLVPFAKLRAGGQNRRFQVQPRSASQRDSAALDEQTLQQLLAWLAANRALWNTVPTSFTINLSIATLEDERFLQKLGAALNTHGIAGETLGFEIAESLCAQQRAKVERFIAQCEKLGAWVAIDDFSFDSQVLPLLRSKALRMLKLDARLTAAALRDKLSQAMVVAAVQAAKVLGIHCSAKKADSHASLQYLTAIGLDYAQGAALSRTVPLEAIATVPESRSGGTFASENN